MAYASVLVITALLTSALTIFGAWFVFERYLRARMWAEVDEKIDELGLLIRERTREGVRQGIAESFEDMRKRATKSATKAPLDMLEESLNLWFGNRRRSD